MMPALPLTMLPALTLPTVQPVASELPMAANSFAAMLSQSTAPQSRAPLPSEPLEHADIDSAQVKTAVLSLSKHAQQRDALRQAQGCGSVQYHHALNQVPNQLPEAPLQQEPALNCATYAQLQLMGDEEIASRLEEANIVAAAPPLPAPTPPLPSVQVATPTAPRAAPAPPPSAASVTAETLPARPRKAAPMLTVTPKAISSISPDTAAKPEGELFEIKLTEPTSIKVEMPSPLPAPAKDSAVPSTAVIAPIVAANEPQLDLAQGNLWIDRVAKEIVAMRQPAGDLAFRLVPAELGKLDIALKQGDNGLSITLETQSEKAQDIITAAQPRLVEELRAQGVRVADAQISNGSSSERQPMPHHRPQTDQSNERQNANTQTESESAPETRGRFA
jgi:flagellar hook-length control protein FliK